jgi:hypothetical protein
MIAALGISKGKIALIEHVVEELAEIHRYITTTIRGDGGGRGLRRIGNPQL